MALRKHRKIVGAKIRSYRKKAGMSQELLAERSELHVKYLSRVELGYVNISLDSLVRIAGALRIKLVDLFRGN
jgi:transcriptional regulator with XRE-family HTH domain